MKNAKRSRLRKLVFPAYCVSLLLLATFPSAARESEELVSKANELDCAVHESARQAIMLYSEAIAIHPKEARYYLKRMSCYRNAKEYENEITDSRVAAKIAPNSVVGHYISSSTNFWKMGNFKDVIRDQSIVVDLDKSNSLAYFIRACAYEEMSMNIEAIRDYEYCLEARKKGEHALISDNRKVIVVYDHLAKIHWKLRDYSGALKDFICLATLEIEEHFVEALIVFLVVFVTGVSILDITKRIIKLIASLLTHPG